MPSPWQLGKPQVAKNPGKRPGSAGAVLCEYQNAPRWSHLEVVKLLLLNTVTYLVYTWLLMSCVFIFLLDFPLKIIGCSSLRSFCFFWGGFNPGLPNDTSLIWVGSGPAQVGCDVERSARLAAIVFRGPGHGSSAARGKFGGRKDMAPIGSLKISKDSWDFCWNRGISPKFRCYVRFIWIYSVS